MCGMSTIMTWSFSLSMLWPWNRFLSRGMLISPGMPVTCLVDDVCVRPASRLTWPSCMRTLWVTLRCPMMGSLSPPRFTVPVTLEISRSISIEISPLSWTCGSRVTFTPTSM